VAVVEAASNVGHVTKRGSSGRLSARGRAMLSPVSCTSHGSSSGTYFFCSISMLCDSETWLLISCLSSLQGGPAKVEPIYILAGNVWYLNV